MGKDGADGGEDNQAADNGQAGAEFHEAVSPVDRCGSGLSSEGKPEGEGDGLSAQIKSQPVAGRGVDLPTPHAEHGEEEGDEQNQAENDGHVSYRPPSYDPE